MEDIGKAIGGLIATLGGLLFFFGSIFAVIILFLGLAIVPATFLWARLTGESYDRICDNSQIIYTLNQVGKWAWIFTLGGSVLFGLILLAI